MLKTKAYLLREIERLKKRKEKLTKELYTLKAFDKLSPELRKTMSLVTKEIDNITIRIETLNWCADTDEKQLPKIKTKKKNKKVNKEIKNDRKITPNQLPVT